MSGKNFAIGFGEGLSELGRMLMANTIRKREDAYRQQQDDENRRRYDEQMRYGRERDALTDLRWNQQRAREDAALMSPGDMAPTEMQKYLKGTPFLRETAGVQGVASMPNTMVQLPGKGVTLDNKPGLNLPIQQAFNFDAMGKFAPAGSRAYLRDDAMQDRQQAQQNLQMQVTQAQLAAQQKNQQVADQDRARRDALMERLKGTVKIPGGGGTISVADALEAGVLDEIMRSHDSAAARAASQNQANQTRRDTLIDSTYRNRYNQILSGAKAALAQYKSLIPPNITEEQRAELVDRFIENWDQKAERIASEYVIQKFPEARDRYALPDMSVDLRQQTAAGVEKWGQLLRAGDGNIKQYADDISQIINSPNIPNKFGQLQQMLAEVMATPTPTEADELTAAMLTDLIENPNKWAAWVYKKETPVAAQRPGAGSTAPPTLLQNLFRPR